MSSSDEDSTPYIQKYFIDSEMLNTFVTFVQDEEREAESSRRMNIPRAPRRYTPRNHADAATRLFNHYFAPEPVFPADYFRRRFRMPKEMFIHIVKDIQFFNTIQPLPAHFQYFHNPPLDVAGVPTINIFQKCTFVVRQLAYAASSDQLDEYLEMGRQTSYDALDNFCKCVLQLYHAEYMRKPAQEDVNRLTAKHLEVHGFPAGSNNDKNVLNESDLFDHLLEDRAPVVNFTANGEQFTKGYYLADGIYPEWSTLVKSFKCLMDPKTTKFKRYQKAARKDVEHAFGVLQGRFHILTHGARPMSINKIKRMMYTCVISHNMVVDYNGRAISPFDLELIPDERPVRTWDQRVGTQLRMMGELRDRVMHHRLRGALVEHIWNLPAQHRQR